MQYEKKCKQNVNKIKVWLYWIKQYGNLNSVQDKKNRSASMLSYTYTSCVVSVVCENIKGFTIDSLPDVAGGKTAIVIVCVLQPTFTKLQQQQMSG
jgi:hypothetical protein